MYCDFKSNNILLDEHLNPRLGDFGQVRRYHDGSNKSDATSGGTSSRINVSMNTAGYICPCFLIDGDKSNPDPRHDLWGLGVGKETHPGHLSSPYTIFGSCQSVVRAVYNLGNLSDIIFGKG